MNLVIKYEICIGLMGLYNKTRSVVEYFTTFCSYELSIQVSSVDSHFDIKLWNMFLTNIEYRHWIDSYLISLTVIYNSIFTWQSFQYWITPWQSLVLLTANQLHSIKVDPHTKKIIQFFLEPKKTFMVLHKVDNIVNIFWLPSCIFDMEMMATIY